MISTAMLKHLLRAIAGINNPIELKDRRTTVRDSISFRSK